MNRIALIALTLWLSIGSHVSHAQLTTYTGSTGFLVTSDFLGPDYTVSNIVFTGFPDAVGSFTGNSCNLGLSKGIVMTTGVIYDASGPQGPNDLASSGVNNYYLGDATIDASLAGELSYNAAVLEFDITSTIDSIMFNYVFGSEEYPEYVGAGFNDQMRILISGPGIVGELNIALLPSGQEVGINTVNAGSNPSYFVNNGNGTTGPQNVSDYYIQYDGFTVPMIASSSVQIGEIYHIRIIVTDVGDGIYDSGVFIEQCETCNFNAGLSTLNMKDISYYPNPSTGTVTIQYPKLSNELDLKIVNVLGETVRTELLSIGSTKFNLSGLSPGTYIMQINNENIQWNERLIVL